MRKILDTTLYTGRIKRDVPNPGAQIRPVMPAGSAPQVARPSPPAAPPLRARVNAPEPARAPPLLVVTLPPAEQFALRAAAQHEKREIGELITEAVREWIARHAETGLRSG